MCSRWFGSASAAAISSRVNCPVRIGSSPLMPCAASPSAIAFTSSGCRLQSCAIWSNDSEVFSTSHTAVAFGIRGAVAIGKSPLRSARPSGRSHSTSSGMTGKWPEYRRRSAPGATAPTFLAWGMAGGQSTGYLLRVPAADGPKQQGKAHGHRQAILADRRIGVRAFRRCTRRPSASGRIFRRGRCASSCRSPPAAASISWPG